MLLYSNVKIILVTRYICLNTEKYTNLSICTKHFSTRGSSYQKFVLTNKNKKFMAGLTSRVGLEVLVELAHDERRNTMQQSIQE